MNTRLEDIGFYTLKDERAKNTSETSPLYRCELILTDACNFNCTYCRGLRKDIKGTMPVSVVIQTINFWADNGLKNIRFSGGEATLYKDLPELIALCKKKNIERIAISTNGSNKWDYYSKLINLGVNDFSVSLDSCCAAVAENMAGTKAGMWDTITQNIKRLSKEVYTTVGCVINEENLNFCLDTIMFADSIGVHDIRVIPSAQYNQAVEAMKKIPQDILNKYKILNYRYNRAVQGKNVRGMTKSDCKNCWLVLDDMAVADKFHFPCIIYMREQGNPIGKIGPDMRKERATWAREHDCLGDEICRNNCLDVCVDYNNRCREYKKGN